MSEFRSVLIVEDEALLRDLMAAALESRGFTVDTAATAADAKRAFRRADPDCVIVDIDLGAGPNGFDLAEVLVRLVPHLPVVFLTNLPDPRFADRDPDGLPSGVAYLRKSALSDVDSLVEALDAALRGSVGAEHRHDRDRGRPLAGLTRKQLAVLRLLASGMSNAQIAQERGTTIKAVEDTVHRIAVALGIDPSIQGNLRVAAARHFLSASTVNPVDEDSGELASRRT